MNRLSDIRIHAAPAPAKPAALLGCPQTGSDPQDTIHLEQGPRTMCAPAPMSLPHGRGAMVPSFHLVLPH